MRAGVKGEAGGVEQAHTTQRGPTMGEGRNSATPPSRRGRSAGHFAQQGSTAVVRGLAV